MNRKWVLNLKSTPDVDRIEEKTVATLDTQHAHGRNRFLALAMLGYPSVPRCIPRDISIGG